LSCSLFAALNSGSEIVIHATKKPDLLAGLLRFTYLLSAKPS
jgi:hypothetical protein